jgi:hypothetical protein
LISAMAMPTVPRGTWAATWPAAAGFVVTGCRAPGKALPQQGEADTDSDYLVVERVRSRNEMDDEVIAAGHECDEPDQPAEGRYPCGEAAEVVADAWQAAQKCDCEQQPTDDVGQAEQQSHDYERFIPGRSRAD